MLSRLGCTVMSGCSGGRRQQSKGDESVRRRSIARASCPCSECVCVSSSLSSSCLRVPLCRPVGLVPRWYPLGGVGAIAARVVLPPDQSTTAVAVRVRGVGATSEGGLASN